MVNCTSGIMNPSKVTPLNFQSDIVTVETSFVKAKTTPTLITILKRFKVMIFKGKKNNLTIGLIKTLIRERATTAKAISLGRVLIEKPGIAKAVTQRATK